MKLGNFLRSNKKNIQQKYFDPFWLQQVQLTDLDDRISYFRSKIAQKNVLHFGCTDWPVFDEKNNLHITLYPHCKSLSGFDIDVEGIENLKKYVPGNYYKNFDEVGNQQFDVCLVPETIEHVANFEAFLSGVGNIQAKEFIITAPNCFSPENISRNNYADGIFTENVHPDHNCWFSPYTLKNVIQKYSGLTVVNVLTLEKQRMVCCECTRKND